MGSKGLLSNIAAMTIFGTINVFVKGIGLTSGEIALWRAVIAVVAILLYKLIRRQNLSFSSVKKDLVPLAVSGIAIGFNWILLFEAYKYTSVSVATLSYYFCPVLLMLLSPMLFGEKATVKQWLCFAFATAGLVLIIGARPQQEGNSQLLGIAFGLGAACLYAFVVIMNKRITSVGGTDKTVYQFAAAIIVLSVYVPFTSGVQISALDSKGLLLLTILGAVHTGLAYCLYFYSVGKLTGQKLAIFSYIDPLVAIIISIAFLKEQVTAWQLVGGAMILGFTLLNELSSSKSVPAAVSE